MFTAAGDCPMAGTTPPMDAAQAREPDRAVAELPHRSSSCVAGWAGAQPDDVRMMS